MKPGTFKEFPILEARPGTPIETIDEVRKFTQETGKTIYHPVGTCKMGQDSMTMALLMLQREPCYPPFRTRYHGCGWPGVLTRKV